MLGVVVPAHDEARLIRACLASLKRCCADPALLGESVKVVVVADACTDGTASIVEKFGITVLSVDARNVGIARAAGAELLMSLGARWLAFTDADTRVAGDWLAQQLALQSDVVCGTVQIDDWSAHGDHAELLAWHFSQTYFDVENHSHVHGANLGMSAEAYRRVGGFRPLACSEDVALVEALSNAGCRIAWSAKPRVITSARTVARAKGGFANALLQAVAMRLNISPDLPSNVQT